MGTRSTVTFIDEWSNEPICCIYQQYDGYPEGVGKALAEFLQGIEVVNGVHPNDPRRIANGMGCLAAQYIAAIKTVPGNVYMVEVGDRQEYNYEVRLVSCKKDPIIEVDDHGKSVFTGTADEYLRWLSTFCEEDD